MMNWLRRVDPAFYSNEPVLLRRQAQIARYTEDAQAEVRLQVLAADQLLHVVTAVVALAAYVAATGAGAIDPRTDPFTVWALAVLALAVPRALPWQVAPDALAPRSLDALIAIALVALPQLWTHIDLAANGLALGTGATIFVVRGRGRRGLLFVAIVALLFAHLSAHRDLIAPWIFPLLAVAGAGIVIAFAIGRTWHTRPGVAVWGSFAALLAVYAYAFAVQAPAIGSHVQLAQAAIAVAYLGVCIVAGRIRHAELVANPDGVLSTPQSIVPLLDRSQDHAVICWLA